MIRLYRIPHSTNVERVALALAHKGLEAESVWINPADRSEVRHVSGQDLVPVLDDGGRILSESMEIVRYLEERNPDPPLYPSDPARRAEMLIFVDWFNRVWKRPPNDMEAELEKTEPDWSLVEDYSRTMRARLSLFEDMLAGRDYLMGEDFSAADCCAFPFLKYAVLGLPEGDDELFHQILRDHQPLGETHPLLDAWIHRVDERPRV